VKKSGVAQWWKDAFRWRYLECYAHRDDAAAVREAGVVAKLLKLRRGARLLDVGCGAGRHVRAFADRGARVVGVDLSKDLLDEAMRRGRCHYVQADVRRLPFDDETFAHVTSLFTSFGYFDAAGDRRHLREMRRVLRRGGTFVIDFLNPKRVRAQLVPESRRKSGEYEIRERRFIRRGRVEKEVELHDLRGGLVEKWTESVRLYGRPDLEALLVATGFKVLGARGDLEGARWRDDAERLVLVAVAK